MTSPQGRIVPLSEMVPGQEADLFVLLVRKETLNTREGKPYERVTFRDALREVSFPVWDNSPWAAECRSSWNPGTCYKVRALYRDTPYGPQLDIRKIRPVVAEDAEDGFDRARLLPHSRFSSETMFQELLALVDEHVREESLRTLTKTILAQYQAALLNLPAARRKHHAYAGGWLEHTLSVTRTAAFWAGQYAELLSPPLDTSLVVAGAVLHDIGKLRELESEAAESVYTPAGELIGHLLLGRDVVREAAAELGLPAEATLRLEHLIIAHQGPAEGGTLAMTPEALLVSTADALDARLSILANLLREAGPRSTHPLAEKLWRGLVRNGGDAGGEKS